MKIDIQCHYYPDELIEKLLERDTPPRAFKKNGQTILMASEHTTLPALPTSAIWTTSSGPWTRPGWMSRF